MFLSITVADTELPTIACPDDISVGTDNGLCTAEVTFSGASGGDNCDGYTIAQTGGPGQWF